MADIQLLLEAERRGLLPPDKKALLDEARRRGMLGGVTATAPESEVTTNPLKGFAARGAELLGSGIELAAQAGERIGDVIAEKAPILDTRLVVDEKGARVERPTVEQIRNENQMQYMFDWAKSLKDWGREINYQPSTQLGDIADNPLNAVPFIVERVITSSPDMAAAVGAPLPYIATRSYEILNQRVKNDNKTLDEATIGDVASATGAAIVEGTLERFATGRLLGGGVEAATAAARVGKEAAIQAGTEAAEEVASYAGETAGTQAGFDPRTAALTGLEAAIVGGGLGAGVQGGREYFGPREEAETPPVRGDIAPSPEPKSVSPDETVSPTPEQLAEQALREIGPETEAKQYRKKVEEITGLNPMQAGSLLARLTKRGVITAPDEAGLRNLGEVVTPVTTEAPTPKTTLPDIDMMLGDVEVVTPTVDEGAAEKFKATVAKVKGAPPPVDFDQPFFDNGRVMVLSDINGVQVPFYLSTGRGGKKTVAEGRWYPFFGYGQDGWINKGTEEEINNFYGSPALKAKADELNSKIGDIRNLDPTKGELPFAWDGKSKRPDWKKKNSVIANPNEGFAPISYNDKSPDAFERFKSNVADAVARVQAATDASREAADAEPNVISTPKVERRGRRTSDALSVSGGRAGTVDATIANAVASGVEPSASVAKQPVAGKADDDVAVEKAAANTPKERYESVLARLQGLESTARMNPQVAARIRRTLTQQGNPAIPNIDYEPILSQAEQMVSKAEDLATEIESGKAQVFNRKLKANERLNLNEAMLREQETMAKLRAVQERRREEATASIKELRSRFAREDEAPYVPELRTLLEANEVNSAAKVLARAGAVNDQPKRFRPIYKAVADKVKDIDFSRIRIQTEDMPGADLDFFKKLKDDGKLGEFDPRTNTIHLRSERLNANTVLHELVHAGTVQTIRQYELDPSKLTRSQRQGVDRLMNLYSFVQEQNIDPTLVEEYNVAFENPYEFIAVAMTSPGFQHRLAKLEYTDGPRARNAWTDFVKAIARVFGLRIDSKNQYTALDEAGQAFSQVLAAPTETVEGVAPLAARKKAEEKPPKPKKDLEEEMRKELEAAKVDKFNLLGLIKYRLSKEGANKFVQDYQNAQRPADVLQADMDRAEVAIYDGDDMNTLGAALDRSAGRLRNNENALLPYFQALDKALNTYATKMGIDVQEALIKLGKYFTAETADQRRITNYIKEKPLRTEKELRVKGIDGLISYAQYRDMLIDSVLTNRELTNDQRDRLYQKLLDLTVNDTVHKFANPAGGSYGALDKNGQPRKPGVRPLDITDDYYNIISFLSHADTKTTLGEMAEEMKTNGAEIKAVRQALLDVNQMEQKFNEEAGFLSQPAKNLIKLYGWDKYVPLAGKMKKAAQAYEDLVYRNSMPNEIIPGFRGRETVGNNPILMTKINAGKSAARAANTDVTLSLTNLMKPHPRNGKKYVKGELVTTIPFKDQYTGEAQSRLADEGISGKRNMFYQRLSNGDLAIWRVDDPSIVDAIRPEFDPGSFLRRGLQTVTNAIGQGYTRYQPKFPPYDFVRNVSFNTGAFKSEFGTQAASNYILDVGSAVFKKFRLPQMWKISRLHSVGDMEGIQKLGGYNSKTGEWKDPFIRGAYEFLERGGKVSVVQTWQTQRRLQRELEALERGPARRYGRAAKDFIDGYFDAWIDTFDLVARVVAYNTAKSIAVNTRNMSETAAQNFATNFAKNLANFEKRGAAKAAKRLGAAYAFFAPSATGAVRNLDALAPAFKDVDTMISELSPEIRNDPQAVETYRKNYQKLRENARGAMGIYFGVGMMSYLIALSLGTLAVSAVTGDEEDKKNAVAEDEMELWTRNLRLPLNWLMEGEGKRERFFQIPWGFGMGSFAAAGAQVMSVLSGNQDLPSAMANTAVIGLDSYVPLPVARYNPWGNLGVWALDSVMPTAARGMFEYAVNLDGLGRQVYRDYHNRFGPAYVSGGSAQEAYRDLSKYLADVTNQSVAMEPSEIKFILGTYFDGGAALVADFYDMGGLIAGKRDFDPKQDLLIFDSFFGSKIDKNVSDYQEVRKKVERFRTGYMNAANSPREGAINRFTEEYPNAGGVAWRYNQLINDINQYNEGMSTRLARAETSRERQQIEDEARATRTLQMRRIIDMYEQNKKEIDKFNRFAQLNPF